MPADKKAVENFLDDGANNEQERVSALLRAIRAAMDDMTPEELERLYAATALMEKKKTGGALRAKKKNPRTGRGFSKSEG